MSLTSALNTAQAIFNNTGKQSSVVSNNIANAGNASYNRREAMLTTSLAGATVVQIARAQEPSLQRQFWESTSDDAAQERLLQGLQDIQSGTLGGNNNEIAPSKYLSDFQQALASYGASPNDSTAADGAINAAQDLATALNNATNAVQGIRENADKEISNTVDTLNGLLAKFKTANDAVISATGSGTDPNDALDQRDGLLTQISQIVGIKTVTRGNNDVAIYTSDGTTLFETLPRTVSFKPTNAYTAGQAGNAIYIDGVPVNPGQGADTNGKGNLQALLQIRDDIAPTYQKQLDEIARGLVTMFSEKGTGSPAAATKPGLFTWTPAGGVPASTPAGTSVIDGIAGSIKVDPKLITSKGGNPSLLRDGGINGAGYVENTTHDAGYSDRLDDYDSAMNASQNFDSSAGIDASASILQYGANSVGWLEALRSSASDAADGTAAQLSHATTTYSNETGVNLDEELTLMMDIEQSYKAGTKILNAVNEMLQSLLDIAS